MAGLPSQSSEIPGVIWDVPVSPTSKEPLRTGQSIHLMPPAAGLRFQSSANFEQTLREILARSGVTPATPEAVGLRLTNNLLTVQAAASIMPVVERTLRMLNTPAPPPPVGATAKLLGITEQDNQRIWRVTQDALQEGRPATNSRGDAIARLQPGTNYPGLVVRAFKVDPSTLILALDEWQGQGPGLLATNPLRAVTNRGGVLSPRGDFINQTNAEASLARLAKMTKFFNALGVDLVQPKAVFFNDRLGMLLVRATPSDMDTIEQAIDMLNATPPQLEIAAKYVEVTHSPGEEGLSWLPASVPREQVRLNDTNGPSPMMASTNPPGLQPGLTAILTPAQYKAVLKALEQRKGADVLSAPRVTTLSGRQAQIKVVDVRYVVTGLQTNAEPGGELVPITQPFECGPVLDVVPHVRPDGHTLELTVIPTLREFLGYDLEGASEVQKATGARAAAPLPKFRLRQVTTMSTLRDGQTLMLGAGTIEETVKTKDKVPVLGDVPLMGRLFQSVSASLQRKSLFIFLTPTLIDPAGNPVHSPEE
jgi:type II secretory pathway component GspD/PulD (secretin)